MFTSERTTLRLAFLLVAAGAAFVAPATARANFTLAGSVGSGWQAGDTSGRIPTNIMIAPGLELLGEFLRFELGFQADLPDVEGSDFDLQIRPMLVLQPLPMIYGRLTSGVTQVVTGDVHFALGLSVGLNAEIKEDFSFFAEAGFVPRVVNADFVSIFEGRVGLGVGF